MKKENRTYIGNSNVYLTERGENLLLGILITAGIILLLAVIGLINIHFFTPEKCRDGFFDIKRTEVCHQYRLG